jgi:PhzF family phenazine biosynthesis protein
VGQRIVQVDAFTATPFAGNPAGVCILLEARDAVWMQNIAREMNLAETAFLVRQDDSFHLRWFTPSAEVALCGHATLASAHVLWEEGHLSPDETARFHTLSGLLTAERLSDWIEMDFPAIAFTPFDSADLIRALGVTPLNVVQSDGAADVKYLVEAASEEIVRGVTPDLARLATLPAQGAIVTSRATSSPEYDFVSRFFAPAVGVPEDPVTGSAHCLLATYWAAKLSKNEMVAYQASPRGGVVRVRLDGDRVRLSGQAVTVLRGDLAF